jgi:glycosyltransferase involved in cell wall biosynthesis
MILFCLPLFSGGGAERVTLNILAELHYRGHIVSIIVFDDSGPLKSMVPTGVPIYNLHTLSLRRSIFPLIKRVRRLKPKVIFSTLGYINVAILSFSWLFSGETKVWIREANLPSISLLNNSRSKIMKILYRMTYSRSEKLICTSNRMKDEFIADYQVPKDQINILHNLVDTKAVRSASLFLERFDKGGVCYVASGRLIFQKGFDRLLYWFDEILDERSTLTILGDGPLKVSLMNTVTLLKLKDRVRFIGFCDNPWAWYAGADVFLLPSRWEGMPNSVLESLVCGTPVIATKESGGVREIVSSNENDIFVAENDKQFIHAMKKAKIKESRVQQKSLLSKEYEKENILRTIEGWL